MQKPQAEKYASGTANGNSGRGAVEHIHKLQCSVSHGPAVTYNVWSNTSLAGPLEYSEVCLYSGDYIVSTNSGPADSLDRVILLAYNRGYRPTAIVLAAVIKRNRGHYIYKLKIIE